MATSSLWSNVNLYKLKRAQNNTQSCLDVHPGNSGLSTLVLGRAQWSKVIYWEQYYSSWEVLFGGCVDLTVQLGHLCYDRHKGVNGYDGVGDFKAGFSVPM